ncbi:hydrolase 1, exosortase A system-associated [Ectothiorhodospira shaposhnikovii]|uniref:hydrolase 1, exosortase A system-associated n=1 Tax=Ectothiorhodospira shaposhnikovii TaxID=1054 RepID=UPI0039A05B76
MSAFTERALCFPCGDDELLGVAAVPDGPVGDVGVIVVVGGPQYRVGSHRQFLLLSRYLAGAGFACLRFDFRGCGDATGESRGFESVDDDIRAAVDALLKAVPRVRQVVLWGLCDGAWAAGVYAPKDARVAGLVLLNPWLGEVGEDAGVVLKHYYLRRFLDRGFWRKVWRGRVSWHRSGGELLGLCQRVFRRGDGVETGASLSGQLRDAVLRSKRPVLWLLSGRDLVARRFERVVEQDPVWSSLLRQGVVMHIEGADHTFSRAQWRDQVAASTLRWLHALQDPPPPPAARVPTSDPATTP